MDTLDKIKKHYIKFGSNRIGDEAARKQTVQAIGDDLSGTVLSSDKEPYPDNIFAKSAEQTVQNIHLQLDDAYLNTHPGLSENIQADLLKFIEESEKKLKEKDNPFHEEAAYVDKIMSLNEQQIVSDEKNILSDYQNLSSVKQFPSDINYHHYENALSKQCNNDNEREEQAANARLLQKDMQTQFVERQNRWMMSEIDQMRKDFEKQLNQKIENFKKLESVLSPFFDDTGFLWDMSEGMFQNSGFQIIQTYADLLERDKSLQELAKLLGRQNRAQKEYEKEMREKVVFKTEFHPKPAYKGLISGITMSNDISSVLPSELALLKNPATKQLFKLKFAQKQLLSFSYQHLQAKQKEESIMEEVDKEKEDQKGPIIICVDTSGSMSGTPENVAKTLTFALTKVAIEEKRKCFLISFSSRIETLDLSDFSSHGKNPLQTLIQFLRKSFNGGTDALPALNHAIKMLQTEDYKKADVLMISDFVMSDLPKSMEDQIKAEKQKESKFYSLVIGDSGNHQTMSCFDRNWSYNMNDRNASSHLVEITNEFHH